MRDWHHLIIGGEAAVTHAFVAGVLADRGIDVALFWGDALGLEPHAIGERLRDYLLGDHHEELFAPADVADVVVAAIAAGGGTDVRVTGRQVVRAVGFAWTARCAARQTTARIRAALIENLPAGVTASSVQEAEYTDPSAAGIEGYKPVHDFEYRGSGRISGNTPATLALYADIRAMDFVRVSPLELDLIPA